MESTLDAHPEDGVYYLTANVPAKMGLDGHLHEYRTPGVPPLPVRDSRGATTVSRFEFLAHLAALDESTLYTMGDVAIAVQEPVRGGCSVSGTHQALCAPPHGTPWNAGP